MNIVITDIETVTQDDLSFKGIEDADIILCNKTPLNRGNLKNAKNLRYIGLFATGFNNIDIPYCKEKGVVVCNAPDYSTDAVA